MRRLLFLPLLQMPSGHHQVADAVIRALKKRQPVDCRKVDLLSYSSEWLEKVITSTYLKWIHHSPHTYEKAYRTFASSSSEVNQHFGWYERLFLKKMAQLLQQERPDLIVCTHGFPSFLLSRLKEQGKLATPVINVYTDFFINTVWGRDSIDYHFVADEGLKPTLRQSGVPEDRIVTTGVPIDDAFTWPRRIRQHSPPYHVLVSGGSNGLGHFGEMLQNMIASTHCLFKVLCGNNRALYSELASLNIANIQPIPYLASRVAMNQLYDSVDAIFTKAGGVTVSEALYKRLPVFIHSTLPGQEAYNWQYLKQQGLVHGLESGILFEQQLIDVLGNASVRFEWQRNIEAYHRRLEVTAAEKILQLMKDNDSVRREGV